MTPATEQVFVYGTLRPPQPQSLREDSRFYDHIADLIRDQTPARLEAASLLDMGSYPAALPGEGVIHGDLLSVAGEALAVMDRLEGHPEFYRRARATVQTGEGPVEAWVYWAPPAFAGIGAPIPSGNWFKRPAEAAPTAFESASADDPTLRRLLKRFQASPSNWLTTVRPSGRPHSAPIWHVWFQGRIYVVTTRRAVKVANLHHRPGVVMSVPDPDNPIILEGWAIPAPHRRAQVRPLFQAKYEWDIDTSPEYDTVIEITPTKLLAWGEYGEGRWSGPELLRISAIK